MGCVEIRSTHYTVPHVPKVSSANGQIFIERRHLKGTEVLSLFLIASLAASTKTLMGRTSYPGLTFDTKMMAQINQTEEPPLHGICMRASSD